MGYLHIPLLYKAQDVLLFKNVYAMEKIHGTSAHLRWDSLCMPDLTIFSGGESYEKFVKIFDVEALKEKFKALFGETPVTVFGEAYGGKCQGMSGTYGKDLKFIVFDVRVGNEETGVWLSVPDAADIAAKLGLEFVHYELVETDLAKLDALRDADSVQATRNGCGSGHVREGVVLRPPVEVRTNNGARLIAKYKGEKFSERASTPKVNDPERQKVLEDAAAIAKEWVTSARLEHVTGALNAKLARALEISDVPAVLNAMIEDVEREAKGEIVVSKEARRVISAKTAQMFKQHITQIQGN